MFSHFLYVHSKFWVIFWLLICFPIAIVLFANGWAIQTPQGIQKMRYRGHRFWLFFWGIVFVPVSIVLFIINGLTPISSQKKGK